MEKFYGILFSCCSLLLYTNTCKSQKIKNFGDAKMHTTSEIGIFASFINDGMFSGEKGTLGFYGNNTMQVSGSQIPTVSYLEIANENGLFLDIPIEVNNTLNFIYGNITTNKAQDYNFISLKSNASYQGESNFSKVDGFIEITSANDRVLFPTGDEEFLRPLAVHNAVGNTNLKCAYFFENPNTAISTKLNTGVSAINSKEFWKLYGEQPLEIVIGWDSRSAIGNLTTALSKLTVVGYHKESKEWVSLGVTETNGTITAGFISSEKCIPNNYEAFTFGVMDVETNVALNSKYYLITPNGDGKNDFLYLPELENYTANSIQIFNRYGRKVFEKENYYNEFTGIDTKNKFSFSKEDGLPSGVYYYIVNIPEVNKLLQGFLYLNN